VRERLFSDHVRRALEEMPEEFRKKMENVEILVEDFADRETLDSVGVESPYGLLGLYVGVPITQQSVFSVSPVPDRICLYRMPILRSVRNRKEIAEKIREVLIHEVGHHFGFDDHELDEMSRRSS
jgi:predicted Zn-dependent protease with MMP-like domain